MLSTSELEPAHTLLSKIHNLAGNEAVEKILQSFIQTICTHYGWQYGVACIDDEQLTQRWGGALFDHLPAGSPAGKLLDLFSAAKPEVREKLFSRFLPANRVEIVTRLASEMPLFKLCASDLNVRSLIALPLRHRGLAVGLVLFFSYEEVPAQSALHEELSHAAKFIERIFNARINGTENTLSAQALLHLLECIPGFGICALDRDGCVTAWSKSAQDVYGYSAEEILGRHCTMFYALESLEAGQPADALRAAAENNQDETECWQLRKNGSRFRANATIVAQYNAALEPRCFIMVTRDVSDQHAIETSLHESEQRFRAIFDYAGLGIGLADPADQKILHCNPAFRALLGYRNRSPQCPPLSELMHPADWNMMREYLGVLLRGGNKSFRIEARLRHSRGYFLWGNLTVSQIDDHSGRACYLLFVVEDITGRKTAEYELQLLQRQIADIPVREQRRIGQELHDNLGQQLTGISMLAKSLEAKLRDERSTASEKMAELAGLIGEAQQLLRLLARGLVPVDVDAHGLMNALKEMTEHYSRITSIQFVFECSQPVPVEDNQLASQLFRIAQEATANAVKHANPRTIAVSLTQEDARLVLKIRDDGTGFTGQKNRDGLGLKIMRYRAGIIGAGLKIESPPEGGTLITCALNAESGGNDLKT